MAPIKQIEKADGSIGFTFSGSGYAIVMALIAAVGGGAGYVGATAKTETTRVTESHEWQMAERDRIAIRREVSGFKEEMTVRFDRLEKLISEQMQSAAYCCARVNALERQVERHAETGARP